ncbi:MAG TPA: sigma-70 family RNA polymerase sigma factor, partial [Ktedonobacterales bacterium]
MVWQETPLPPGARLDAEQERELRLISQARAGADWALAALVARYQPMVVRYLTRLVGDTERARELAEEVFLRMERRLRGPHGGEYLRLWLLRACTEAGLDALRRPRRGAAPRLDAAGSPARLLSEHVGSSAQRLRSSFGKLAERTSATNRQMRHLIWADEPAEAPAAEPAFGAPSPVTSAPPSEEALDPRAALRHQMVRAVLAEIPYGDAQCVALHLVAGLNQAEVAQALGIRASAAR